MEPKLIGVIHTPYKTTGDAPFQGMSSSETCEVEIFKEYKGGLKDIDQCPYLILLYWLDGVDYRVLQTHTLFDTDIHGGFATQTPNRPNPIGFHVAELIDRKENVLKIKGVDALDKTLLIDIKPYPCRDYGKTAVAVAGKDDIAIRITLSPDFEESRAEKYPEANALFEKLVVRREEPTPGETVRLMRLFSEMEIELLEYGYSKLFTIERKTITLLEYTPIFASVRCSTCGESTMETCVRITDGKSVCIPCAGDEHYATCGDGIYIER